MKLRGLLIHFCFPREIPLLDITIHYLFNHKLSVWNAWCTMQDPTFGADVVCIYIYIYIYTHTHVYIHIWIIHKIIHKNYMFELLSWLLNFKPISTFFHKEIHISRFTPCLLEVIRPLIMSFIAQHLNSWISSILFRIWIIIKPS